MQGTTTPHETIGQQKLLPFQCGEHIIAFSNEGEEQSLTTSLETKTKKMLALIYNPRGTFLSSKMERIKRILTISASETMRDHHVVH